MVGVEGKKWKKKKFSRLNAKKFRMKKGTNEAAKFKPSNVINQACLPIVDSAGASTSAASPAPSSGDRPASEDKEKHEEAFMNLSGFIFLCSRETKLDCFRFRVFGLRSNKKESVEKIKPGTKLFLFDVELKLLYGVYEAADTGKLDLEPLAFGGKYRAQVKFQIFKECLPLQEASFRHAIKDNYHGRKFKRELNDHQVSNLLSLFAPLPASATAAALTYPLAEVGSSVGPPNTDPALDRVQSESNQQHPLSTAYVDAQNSSDDIETDSSEETEDTKDALSGFIFLCGRNTKPDCYRFRVFGLPSNKLERLEKIKPGTKLFLFDYELKLLYGVYEATSTGKKDLEPLAFGGKFPAQVNFRIFKESLPLPEASFRHAIKDNYHHGKFEPELNDQQVRDLLCLFRPLAASATAAAVPYRLAKLGQPLAMDDRVKVLSYPQATVGSSMANFVPPNTIPPLRMEHQVQYPSMRVSVEDPYMTRIPRVHPPPMVESQPVYEQQSVQHGWHRTTHFIENTVAVMEHQNFTAPTHTYSHQPYENSVAVMEHQNFTAPTHAYSHQPYVTRGISTDMWDPHLRSRSVQDMAPSQQHSVGLNGRNYLSYSQVERQMLPPQQSIVTANYYYGPSVPYAPQVLQQNTSETVVQEGTSSQVQRQMVPPQQSIVTPNYYYGASVPYAPQVLQQNTSETVAQGGTSSMSFQQYPFVQHLG